MEKSVPKPTYTIQGSMDDSVEKHNIKASTFKRMSHQVSTDSTSAVVGALSSLLMKRHTIHSDGTADNQGSLVKRLKSLSGDSSFTLTVEADFHPCREQ